MGTEKKSASSWESLYVIPILFLILFGTLTSILFVINIPEIFLSLIYGPIIEEIFKFWIAKKYHLISRKIIYNYAIFEFCLVKIPLILNNNEITAGALVAFPAMIFHFATAHAYSNILFRIFPFFTLSVMTFFHFALNAVAESNVSDAYFLVLAGTISVCPFFWLLLGRKFRRHHTK